TVKKALIAPLRDKWNVDVKGGDDLIVQGNILDLEYDIKDGRKMIAEVSKKWFSITDTYGVEIKDGQDDILILAVAVAIDMMAHDEA
ncbi:MAG TPA: LURP-one-related family protein, partial [Anaerolineales bacterium]|nr:LURP-one-related family protein [Anaerolineales bacterium]